MASQSGPLTAEELALIKAAVAAAAANTSQNASIVQTPVGATTVRTPQPLPSQNSLQELGRELLQQAADGMAQRVSQLIKQGAPFTTDWLGTSPLHMAAMYGHLDVAEVLLEAGISRDPRTKVDKSPLHLASTEGYTAIVELLLKKEAEVNCRDMLNMTPLHWAVERAHIECIEWLLRCGADVEVKNKFDKTPRDIASDNGHPGIMEMLENYEVYRADNPLAQTSEAAVTATQEAVNSILPDLAAGPSVDELLSPVRPELPPPTPPPLVPPEPPAGSEADLEGKTEALRLLASHGITMLPVEDASTVPAGLTSGKTISLTAAGALALGVTKPTSDPSSAPPRTTAATTTVNTSSPRTAAATATAAAAVSATAGKPHAVRNGKVSKIIKLTPEMFAKLTAARPGGGKAPLSLKLPLGSLKKAARPAEPGDSPAKRLKLVSLGAATTPTAVTPDVGSRLTVGASEEVAGSDSAGPPDVAKLRAQLAAAELEASRLRQLCREKEAEVERCRQRLAAATSGNPPAPL